MENTSTTETVTETPVDNQAETPEVSAEAAEVAKALDLDPDVQGHFKGVERVQPKPEDLEGIDWAEPDDWENPANKGAIPLHVLRERGLLDDNILMHLKEYRRGYTQSKQEAAALRKQLEELQTQSARTTSTPATPMSTSFIPNDEFYNTIKTQAEMEITDKDQFTPEGIQKMVQKEAAKTLLPQLEQQRQWASEQQQRAAQTARQQSMRQWVAENDWVLEPETKQLTAEYVKQGMDLQTAAYRAYNEISRKPKTKEVPASVATSGGRSKPAPKDISPEDLKSMSAVDILNYYKSKQA